MIHIAARDIAQKKSPFAGCYLCKLEPGSQHLHVLGNAIPTERLQELELAAAKSAPEVVLPEFYRARALYVRNVVKCSPPKHSVADRQSAGPHWSESRLPVAHT